MMSWMNSSLAMLAEGGWSDLIGIIVLVGIYAVGALVKAVSNRSAESKEDAESKNRAVELAKKYAQKRQSATDKQSEWDRMQEIKRHRQAQLREHGKQTAGPVSVPIYREEEKSVSQHIPVSSTPEFIPPAKQQKVQIFQQYMETLQQQKKAVQPPRPKAQTVKAAAKAVKQLRKPPITAEPPTVRPLDQYLRNVGDLRAAIILKEILDKPVGLRENW